MITRIGNINDLNCALRNGRNATKQAEFYGKSTDTKPTEGVRNADVFYEMDTKKVFLFDEDGQAWLEQ